MSGGVLASAAGGTPKSGYDCNRCEDWGNIVEGDFDPDRAHGGTAPLSESPCPNCRPDVQEAP